MSNERSKFPVIDRRIKAIIRKYKLSGLSVISVLGLASVFSVNLAGFIVLLPRPLWGLLDAGFVTGYFLRVSILLALAILASRYSDYIASTVLGLIYRILVIISLLTKKAGRRLIRFKGYESSIHIASSLLKLHDNEVKGGNEKSKFEALAKGIYKSSFARPAMGLFSIMAYTQGRVEGRVEYFKIPIQLLAFVVVLSTLFTTLTGSISLVALGITLFFVIPPTPTSVYYAKPYFENGISFSKILRFESLKMVNTPKAILLVLTISFTSGILHHRSLVSEVGLLKFVREEDSTGAVVLSTSSGFIIHSSGDGYQFIPIEGTRIELVPLDAETSD